MARMYMDFDVRLRRFRHAQVVGEVIFAQSVSGSIQLSEFSLDRFFRNYHLSPVIFSTIALGFKGEPIVRRGYK